MALRDIRRGLSNGAIGYLLLALAAAPLSGCETLRELVAPAPPPEPTPNLLPRERLQLAIDLLDHGDSKRAAIELKAYRASLPNPNVQAGNAASANRTAAADAAAMMATGTMMMDMSAAASANMKPASQAQVRVASAKAPDVSAPAATPAPEPAQPETSADPWIAIRENVDAHRYDAAIRIAEANHVTTDKAQAQLLASAYIANAKAVRGRNAAQAGAQALRAGQLYLETADMPEEALDALQVAVAVSPNDARAKTLLASAKNKTAEIYYRNGLIAFRKQDLDGAIAAWDRVLEIDPNYEKAQSNRTQAVELKKTLQALK